MNQPHDAEHMKRLADLLIDLANTMGVVITIELEPQQPFAMGNYKMVAHVRPSRNPKTTTEAA